MSRRSSEKKENLWIKISIGITISSVLLGLFIAIIAYLAASKEEKAYQETHKENKIYNSLGERNDIYYVYNSIVELLLEWCWFFNVVIFVLSTYKLRIIAF